MKKKLIRVATVPISLDKLLEGQLHYLNQFYDIIGVSGEDELLRKVEEREGIKVCPIKMQRSISPIKDLVSLWKLYCYFKKEKPFIVHSITPKAGLLSMTAAYFTGVPVRVHTFTGLIFPTKQGLFRYILILMDKTLCRFATNIYPEGQGVKEDLIKHKITKKTLKVLANGNINGIDTAYFDPNLFTIQKNLELRLQLDISPNSFVFVFVGRLVGDKGINELVEAYVQLKKAVPYQETSLLLVGPFENELDPLEETTLIEMDRNSSIISVGYQPDVRPYFAMSDALVFPSYREGFPNVVMQAGSMGLPSIVTDINGCNEIIANKVNGIVIPPKDAVSLTAAMNELLCNEETINLLSSNSRKMIVERYERQEVWEVLLREYQSLLSLLDDQSHV
jgi:glycosyltransferase involved in cell wall biosynthesis